MRLLTVTDSDVIEAVGFDNDNLALEVVFKSAPADVYRYECVPADAFAKLVSAPSIGKTFHEMFRKSRHPFTKSARSTLKK